MFEWADVPTVRGLVGAGLGVAVLPPAVGPERRGNPPETDLSDAGAERTVGMAHVRGRYLSVAARRLQTSRRGSTWIPARTGESDANDYFADPAFLRWLALKRAFF